jgi:hypothetical protein
MRLWEYCLLSLPSSDFGRSRQALTSLNRLGQEGWDLITLTPIAMTVETPSRLSTSATLQYVTEWIACFKREVVQTGPARGVES